MKNLPEGAGSPISRMPQQQKAGYNQHTSPQNNIISSVLDKTLGATDKTSPALEYWKAELASRESTTIDIYLRNFTKFTDFIGKTADELLAQREENQTNKDRKIQRQSKANLSSF